MCTSDILYVYPKGCIKCKVDFKSTTSVTYLTLTIISFTVGSYRSHAIKSDVHEMSISTGPANLWVRHSSKGYVESQWHAEPNAYSP